MTDKDVLGVISYIVSVFFISMVFGNKATFYFVILVLLGVLFINADKINNMFVKK